MKHKANNKKCPVLGCKVITFTLRHEIAAIGDDAINYQTEVASDNEYECTNYEHPECVCKQYALNW